MKSHKRSSPVRVPRGAVRIRSWAVYKRFRRAYGLPNAVDVGNGVFGAFGGAKFVDDEDGGRVVAYAAPWVVESRFRVLRRRAEREGGER